MTLHTALLLLAAAAVAGSLNAVAGGGTFITFPSLLFTGMPPVNANATSTVALWPGSLAGIGAYRERIHLRDRRSLAVMIVIAVAGGITGALLLLRTPQATFMRLVPWLLLMATLIFAFGQKISAACRTTASHQPQLTALTGLLEFVVAAYGGFFGAGMGILFLALMAAMGISDIHTCNGYKNLLVTFVNGVAVVTFIIAGAVGWPQALVMMIGSVAGGYGSGRFAQRLDPRLVRGFVLVVAAGITIYFFVTR